MIPISGACRAMFFVFLSASTMWSNKRGRNPARNKHCEQTSLYRCVFGCGKQEVWTLSERHCININKVCGSQDGNSKSAIVIVDPNVVITLLYYI